MLKEEIIRYIRTLHQNFGLQISVHGISVHIGEFLNYGIHTNPYCMLVKQNEKLWHKCRCQQSKIINSTTAQRCGTCFAGVFEYIVPICPQGLKKPIAFISISGYRDETRREKQLHLLSKSYGIDKTALTHAYETHLLPLPEIAPDEDLIAPLKAMLERYLSDAKKTRGSGGDYTYAHAIAFIHQHYKEKIQLDDICAFCHCSKSYLSHMFKKRSGSSVSNYIAALRLSKAKKLLETGRYTVKSVAEAVGFTEPYYFSNSFKKYFNITPSAIRKDDLK